MQNHITFSEENKGLRTEIERNRRTVIIISKCNFETGEFVDLRIHYWPTGPERQLKPTRKMVTIPLSKADIIANAIRAVAAEPSKISFNGR